MPLMMNQIIPNGTKLKTLAGEDVTVLGVISTSGGQGDVYRVAWKNGEYALKWYNKNAADVVGSEQYHTILKLTKKPNPAPEMFIWPQAMVTETGADGGNGKKLFGYTMNLLPDDHYEMGDFLRADGDSKQKKFSSFHAMIWAGLNIVSAVRKLHLKGMSYKDLNPGNAAIQPSTGHVWMMDCDNISVEGEPCTVNGMRGYMAPEIVRSGFQVTPNIQTDQFSLAVVLFRLFYMDHPMEGKIWEKFPVINDAAEDELYCIHPIYNMSSRDNRNRPNETYAPNVMRRMAMLPGVLMEGFENTFVNGIENINGRTPENRWLQILSQARDQLVFLDSQGKDDRVVRFDRKETIPRGCLRLTLNKGSHEIALYPLQSIFKDVVSGNREEYAQRIGRVASSKGRLVMQNLSGQTWKVYDPVIKKVADVADSAWFRILPGTQIQFDPVHKVVGKVDQPI